MLSCFTRGLEGIIHFNFEGVCSKRDILVLPSRDIISWQLGIEVSRSVDLSVLSSMGPWSQTRNALMFAALALVGLATGPFGAHLKTNSWPPTLVVCVFFFSYKTVLSFYMEDPFV